MLLALMTCLTPNGNVHATARQVGLALGVPEPMANYWLKRFCTVKYLGEPVIRCLDFSEGLAVYALSLSLIQHTLQPAKGEPITIHQVGAKETVIEQARAKYGLELAQAERSVMLQLGLHPEELAANEEAVIWRELRYLKIKREDILSLIHTFGVDRIRQQLHWLPERQTKDRAKYLVTALLNGHGPPRTLQDVLSDPNLMQKYQAEPQPESHNPTEDAS
jgi:hypothetical protein